MGLESVVEDILAQGRSEAEEIRRAAMAERERILQDARKQAETLVSGREKEGREAAERLRVQALARAELEGKKIVLQAEKDLLDTVYSKVLEKLSRLEDGDAILRSLLRANEAEWNAGKVSSNAKDAAAVKAVVGSRFGGTIECVGGVTIDSADGSHRTDLRYETLLSEVWRDSIREVAGVLWPGP